MRSRHASTHFFTATITPHLKLLSLFPFNFLFYKCACFLKQTSHLARRRKSFYEILDLGFCFWRGFGCWVSFGEREKKKNRNYQIICVRQRESETDHTQEFITMGRGRVQLKRIDNKINRQVTFSKRRAGFLKKAHEISVLCDAEVAVIIFSHKGKLFEYSTDSCMEKILERYERYAYAERQLIAPDPESQRNWPLECNNLKAKIDLLQKNQRHYLGEDLESLSLKDIQQLEQQLDTALKHIRSRKNQLMQESISELQKKEKSIEEQNNLLVKQIKEREKAAAQQAQWGNQIQNQVPNTLSFLLPQPPPCLRLGGAYQEQASEMRRNELNLTLEPVCSCSLGCFAG